MSIVFEYVSTYFVCALSSHLSVFRVRLAGRLSSSCRSFRFFPRDFVPSFSFLPIVSLRSVSDLLCISFIISIGRSMLSDCARASCMVCSAFTSASCAYAICVSVSFVFMVLHGVLKCSVRGAMLSCIMCPCVFVSSRWLWSCVWCCMSSGVAVYGCMFMCVGMCARSWPCMAVNDGCVQSYAVV